MTAKEGRAFFGEIRRTKSAIRRKELEVEELRASLLPSAIRYDRDRVQTSPSDPLPNVMARIDELEREIEALRTHKAEVLVRIGKAIDQIKDPVAAEIVTEFYVTGRRAAEIAKERTYTTQRIYQIMIAAIRNVKEEDEGNGRTEEDQATGCGEV